MKSKLLGIYSWGIIGIGLSFAVGAVINVNMVSFSLFWDAVIFTLLVTITETLSIEIEDGSAVSTSFAINFCAILVFAPSLAMLTAFIGKMLSAYYKDGKMYHIFNTSLYKRLFNASVSVICVFASAIVYQYASSVLTWLTIASINLLSAALSVMTYTVINLFLYSVLFSLVDAKPFKEIIFNLSWIIRNFNMLAPFGVLMALFYETWNVLVILLFLGPFLLARYTYSMYLDMKKLYYKTINTLTHAIDAKDKYTNGHSHRVAEYAERTARKLGLSPKRVELVRNSAILHDIGKIGISDSIINKPGHLDQLERETIQMHPIIGEEIINEIDAFHEVSLVIRHHHERFDGGGYPDHLKTDLIPLESAIIAVADSFDAMTSDRSYRDAMTMEKAVSIIKEESGRQFHPEVVNAFIQVIEGK